MSKIYLKVKIKSLADEARIIRKEELKALKNAKYYLNKQGHEAACNEAYSLYHGLNAHRRFNVRSEARAALIAYAFLREQPFTVLNEKLPDIGQFGDFTTLNYTGNTSLWARVGRLIYKYGRKNYKPLYNADKECKYPNEKIDRQLLIDWVHGKTAATIKNINNK